MKKHLGVAASAAVLACSASSQPAPTPQQVAEAAALRVLLQVCLPDRKAIAEETIVDVTDVPENVHPILWHDVVTQARLTGQFASSVGGKRELVAVRSARPAEGADAASRALSIGMVRGGVVSSVTGGPEPLADATELGQPIYTLFTHDKPGEILAVYVASLQGGVQERANFWFKMPRELPQQGFTAWLPPTFRETPAPGKPSVRSRLFGGDGLPPGTVTAEAPRIRFMLLSMNDRRRDTEPGLRALRIRGIGELAGFNPVKEGPRVVQGSQPGC